ncbi:hypothetical protein, partial [Vibrio vulnificus]|uniref:hypothetical protein n=1 Tax=Vibrio vulnificus TaxID=672 RepID=UPI0019D492D9
SKQQFKSLFYIHLLISQTTIRIVYNAPWCVVAFSESKKVSTTSFAFAVRTRERLTRATQKSRAMATE